jgi:DNA-binding FadR family transcriptional regulator
MSAMNQAPDPNEQMPSTLQRIGRGRLLKLTIQERVKDFITQHGLGPGDLLPPEGQIAEDLGVSRGSVREAIKSLESLGIVEVRHGDGVRVREFNFDSIFDFLSFGLVFQPTRAAEILQVREWLELAAVGEVAATITEAELDQIEVLLVAWEKKAAAGEPTSAEDRSFHRMLYASLGNASLLSLIDIFWVVYHALPVHALRDDADARATVQAHRDILDALRRRNPLLARQRMSSHFRNIQQRIGAVARPSRAQQAAKSRTRPRAKHAAAP